MLRKIFAATVFTAAALALVAAEAQAPRPATPAASPTVKGRQFKPPYYVFEPSLPPDIVVSDVGAIGFQPYVDNLAWDAFVALNWPAPQQITERGVPDQQNVIGGFKQGGEGGGSTMPVGPVVWETYKDTHDIYLDPPTKLSPFDAAQAIPAACATAATAANMNPAAVRVLSMTSKFDNVLRGTEQSDGNRLVDQNGHNVWYEVKLNRAYYDFVVSNEYYNSANQQGKTIVFPSSSNTTSTVPPVKVKAAWKVMGDPGSRQPDDPKKFYTTTALVLEPNGECRPRVLGLVGLHIVMKTTLLPQWLWATFEHVDNAPDQATGPTPRKKYNFFNSQCAGCRFNQPPSKERPDFPTQVVRVTPVNSVAVGANGAFQAALKSLRPDNVWQNYMLVDAQWAGSRTNIGVPSQPKFLANTVLETYMQAQQEPYGCINCHGKYAASTDLDFQLTNAYPRNADRALDLLRLPGVRLGTSIAR
jgi:hypothetical protein